MLSFCWIPTGIRELRDVSQLNVASPPLLEDTVAVPLGSEATVIGLAVNHLLSVGQGDDRRAYLTSLSESLAVVYPGDTPERENGRDGEIRTPDLLTPPAL